MAASTAVKAARDGQIKLTDGASAAYVVAYEGDGNFSFDVPKADAVVIYDRGAISGVRQGNAGVASISFSVNHRDFTDGSVENLCDFIDGRGSLASASSAATAAFSDFKLFNVTLTIEGTDHGDTADGTAVFADCLLSWSFTEGTPNVVSVSGQCFGGITFTGQS